MASKKEKTLVIVESPAKSKTIKKILGDSFQIEASYGHIRNLPTKDPKTDNLGFDVNNNFEPKFEIIPNKKEVVKKPTKRQELQLKIKEYVVKENMRLIDFLLITLKDKSRNNIKSLLSICVFKNSL